MLLLEGKGGIIEAMNEELRTTGQDISFVQKLKGSTADKSPVIKFPRFSSKADQSTFTICHYAGDVVYNAAHGSGFLAKHKDALFPDLKRLLTTSNIPFMQTLFSDESFALFASPEVSGGGRRRAMSALGAVSVGSQFKQSLAQLLSVLSTSEAHYVRCVKPNTNKLSGGNGDGTGGVGDAFHMKSKTYDNRMMIVVVLISNVSCFCSGSGTAAVCGCGGGGACVSLCLSEPFRVGRLYVKVLLPEAHDRRLDE